MVYLKSIELLNEINEDKTNGIEKSEKVITFALESVIWRLTDWKSAIWQIEVYERAFE